MTNCYGTIMQPFGVISIELTISRHVAETKFFMIDATTRYNALIG